MLCWVVLALCCAVPSAVCCVLHRAGAVQEAVEAYSLAIGLDGTCMAAYTNRAQAYLKLKAWDWAITDCNSALRVADAAEEAAAAVASTSPVTAPGASVGAAVGATGRCVHVCLHTAALLCYANTQATKRGAWLQ